MGHGGEEESRVEGACVHACTITCMHVRIQGAWMCGLSCSRCVWLHVHVAAVASMRASRTARMVVRPASRHAERRPKCMSMYRTGFRAMHERSRACSCCRACPGMHWHAVYKNFHEVCHTSGTTCRSAPHLPTCGAAGLLLAAGSGSAGDDDRWPSRVAPADGCGRLLDLRPTTPQGPTAFRQPRSGCRGRRGDAWCAPPGDWHHRRRVQRPQGRRGGGYVWAVVVPHW